jgi:hypothetical protein
MAGYRWVLAYSERCSSCKKVADGIAALAAGKVEIRGLLEPEVVDWRQSTGHGDDWQPILFRLSDDGPKAYVGRSLAWRLARRLGIRRASEVARLVAGLDEPAISESGSSRRQFIRKTALGAASLAGFGILGRLPAMAKSPGSGGEAGQVLTQRPLESSDALLTTALASSQMSTLVKTHGREAFSDFVHATYAGTHTEAIAVALKPSSGPVRFVFAYFRSGRPSDFKIIQLEIVKDASVNASAPFSGSARALAHDESLIGSAVYRNGTVVSTTKGVRAVAADGAIPYAEDWNCVHYCIDNLWGQLPWYVQLACGSVCAGCFTGIWFACFPCVGCLGGYAAVCLHRCWY